MSVWGHYGPRANFRRDDGCLLSAHGHPHSPERSAAGNLGLAS